MRLGLVTPYNRELSFRPRASPPARQVVACIFAGHIRVLKEFTTDVGAGVGAVGEGTVAAIAGAADAGAVLLSFRLSRIAPKIPKAIRTMISPPGFNTIRIYFSFVVE
ncbi:MAG: hypothetical protein H7Y38_16460 [Armatimonadetes bacterium]|nr:hypothetical protein [Armatimonadota bacterium]